MLKPTNQIQLLINYCANPPKLELQTSTVVKTDYIIGLLNNAILSLDLVNAEVIHYIEDRDLLNTLDDVIGTTNPEPISITLLKDIDTLSDSFEMNTKILATRDIRTCSLIAIFRKLQDCLIDIDEFILDDTQAYSFE